jgi:hypothetical protein
MSCVRQANAAEILESVLSHLSQTDNTARAQQVAASKMMVALGREGDNPRVGQMLGSGTKVPRRPLPQTSWAGRPTGIFVMDTSERFSDGNNNDGGGNPQTR